MYRDPDTIILHERLNRKVVGNNVKNVSFREFSLAITSRAAAINRKLTRKLASWGVTRSQPDQC